MIFKLRLNFSKKEVKNLRTHELLYTNRKVPKRYLFNLKNCLMPLLNSVNETNLGGKITIK